MRTFILLHDWARSATVRALAERAVLGLAFASIALRLVSDIRAQMLRPYRHWDVIEAIAFDKPRGDRLSGRSIRAAHLSVRADNLPPECYRPYRYWDVIEAIALDYTKRRSLFDKASEGAEEAIALNKQRSDRT